MQSPLLRHKPFLLPQFYVVNYPDSLALSRKDRIKSARTARIMYMVDVGSVIGQDRIRRFSDVTGSARVYLWPMKIKHGSSRLRLDERAPAGQATYHCYPPTDPNPTAPQPTGPQPNCSEIQMYRQLPIVALTDAHGSVAKR